jgi:hypothetical protein
MPRTLLSVLLIVSVACVATPAQYASETFQPTNDLYADVTASFEAELTEYAKTHTLEQVAAYAQARLDANDNGSATPKPCGLTARYRSVF